jgi:hypothetical protein
MSPRQHEGPAADRALVTSNLLTNTLTATATAPACAQGSGQIVARGVGLGTRVPRSGKARYPTDIAHCPACGRWHVHRPFGAGLTYARAMPCRPSKRYLIVVVSVLRGAVDEVPA